MDHGPTSARAKALTGAAHLARDGGDPAAGRQPSRGGGRLQEGLGDRKGLGRAVWLGASIADEGDFGRALPVFEEANRVSAEVGDDLNALFANRLGAWMDYELGDRATARTMQGESALVRHASSAGVTSRDQSSARCRSTPSMTVGTQMPSPWRWQASASASRTRAVRDGM